MQDPPKGASDSWRLYITEKLKWMKGHEKRKKGRLEQLLGDLSDEIDLVDFLAREHGRQ
jgi:hypothetical protein